MAHRLSTACLALSIPMYGLLLVSCPASAKLSRLGGEFVINSSPIGSPQRTSATVVASLPNGGFIVTWEIDDGDKGGGAVLMRRFDENGAPVGAEVRVNSSTVGRHGDPDLAVSDDGTSLIVWSASNEPQIRAQRFDSAGQRVGGELSVTSPEFPDGAGAATAAVKEGEFVVAWIDLGESFNYALRHRSVCMDNLLGPALFVSTEEPFFGQYRAAVAPGGADGSFVVVWFEEPWVEIRGRRFAAGAPLGPAFTVAGIAGTFDHPDICRTGSGGFLVVWSGERIGDPESHPVEFRLYDGGGNAIARPTQVTPGAHEPDQREPAAACFKGTDEFTIVWIDEHRAVRGRVLGGDETIDFTIPGSDLLSAHGVSVAVLAGGDLVVTWSDCPREASCTIRGQRFTSSGAAVCPGDCNDDKRVTIDELIATVNIALTSMGNSVGSCLAADTDLDYQISLEEIVASIDRAQHGCE